MLRRLVLLAFFLGSTLAAVKTDNDRFCTCELENRIYTNILKLNPDRRECMAGVPPAGVSETQRALDCHFIQEEEWTNCKEWRCEEKQPCLSGESAVILTKAGKPWKVVSISELTVGSRVAVGFDEHGEVLDSAVVDITHREFNKRFAFVSVDTTGGRNVLLTPDHRIFVRDSQSGSEYDISASTLLDLFESSNIDTLSLITESGHSDKIQQVKTETRNTINSPLTESGFLLVGAPELVGTPPHQFLGLKTSCYATMKHNAAAFMYFVWRGLTGSFADPSTPVDQEITPTATEITLVNMSKWIPGIH